MSESKPKSKSVANPNRSKTASKTTPKEAGKKAPAKKAPVKKTTTAKVEKVVETVAVEVVKEVQANPQVAEAVLDAVKPGLWDKVKAFFVAFSTKKAK